MLQASTNPGAFKGSEIVTMKDVKILKLKVFKVQISRKNTASKQLLASTKNGGNTPWEQD